MHGKSAYLDRKLFERTVPIFRAGLDAKASLESGSDLSRQERTRLRRAVDAGADAYMEICDKAEWIIDRAVSKEMNRDRSFYAVLDADDLRQAGYEAVWKMMRKADPGKMADSAVNYLMQWVNTDVSRAARAVETNYGMSSNKLKTMRKIAAVRSKLAKKIGRKPTDEEVYDFFMEGGADIHTKYGRKGVDGSNASGVTLAMIHEQAKLDKGTNLKYPVTDVHAIDAEVSSPSAEASYDDGSVGDFWRSWFRRVGIAEDQWDRIAGLLDLYDVPAGTATRRSSRLVKEFQELVGSEYGGIGEFADEWTRKYGDGPWTVFSGIELAPGIQPDSVDDHGHRVFSTLRFDGGKK